MRTVVPDADHYAILGVAHTAKVGEIRRAFRQLALRFHPDRAGADSTPIFQRVTRAYEVLKDPAARSAYDASQRARVDGSTRHAVTDHARYHPDSAISGDAYGPTSRATLAARLRRAGQLLERLSRPLDDLVAVGIATRLQGQDIELSLTPFEARRGGVALIDMLLPIICPTCGGIARPGGFWCRRCDSTGRTQKVLIVYCAIHPAIADATTLTIPTEAAGGFAPIHLRLRVMPE